MEKLIEYPNDAEFWDLVELADRDWPEFSRILRNCSPCKVAGFGHMFCALEYEFSERCRAVIDSNDAANEFCGWIVAQGREFFLNALKDPSMINAELANRFARETWRVGIDIRYEAETIYYELTCEELEAYKGPAFEIWASEIYGEILKSRAIDS